jgi:hypothetical protein
MLRRVFSVASIIRRLIMPSAGNEYRIRITVVNETDEYQNIFVFQQEDELGFMFGKLFPLAWQVFPLPGREEGVERKGTTDYPASQQIGVTRSTETACDTLRGAPSSRRLYVTQPPSVTERKDGTPAADVADVRNEAGPPEQNKSSPLGEDRIIIGCPLLKAAALKGTLTILADAVKGDAFQYSLDEKGGQRITRLGEGNKDGSITCLNSGGSLISVDFYKDGSRIAVWPDLVEGDKARFLLKRNIFFAYDDTIKSGVMIKAKIEGENVVSVDPAGYSRIEARLAYDPDSSGKKRKWIIVKS